MTHPHPPPDLTGHAPPVWPTLVAWALILDGLMLIGLVLFMEKLYAYDSHLIDHLTHWLRNDTVRARVSLCGWLLIPAGAMVEYGTAFWRLSWLSLRARAIVLGVPAIAGIGVGAWLGLFAGLMTWIVLTAFVCWCAVGAEASYRATPGEPARRTCLQALLVLLVPALPGAAWLYWYAAVEWNLPRLWPGQMLGSWAWFGFADTLSAALAITLVASAIGLHRRYRLRRRLQKSSLPVD